MTSAVWRKTFCRQVGTGEGGSSDVDSEFLLQKSLRSFEKYLLSARTGVGVIFVILCGRLL